jgi:uncharacterized SAM-binding protein YcdF (DUF218 family)
MKLKKWLRLGLVAAGLILVLVLGLAMAFPQHVLCVDSGTTRADVMVVLGGGSWERPQRAAELFREGAAPRILLTGDGDCYSNRRELVAAGVPIAAIEVESKSRSTKENALLSVTILRRLGARRVILVTSWYHSRRARNCFRHYAPDIEFLSRPAYFGFPRSRWTRDGVKGFIRAEYFKLLGYWVCYGVSPF